jgi:hypothetical protein
MKGGNIINIKKELFNVFQTNKDKYDLYEETLKFIEKVVEDVKGNENTEFYEIIVKLSNSINNAGWEERHSQQIDLLRDTQRKIASKYENYLP